MASYEEVRREHLLRSNSRQARFFATKRYDPNKETVIMLPGGLASQLERSKKKYKPDIEPDYGNYENLWIDVGIIFDKDARKLKITSELRDKNDYVIIPNGPLESFVQNPYDETKKYFRNNNYNYYSWGYDWRRSIEESAELLKDFLTKFKNEVISRFGTARDPLPHTTILCHSMGGLVTKLFLNKVLGSATTQADVRKWMRRMITVATPFYGTSNHIFRYYRGEPLLNIIYKAKNITKLAGTMPGAYILMYLDIYSYFKYHQDIAIPELTSYPFRDMDDPGKVVDPYSITNMSYYPEWVKEDFITLSRNIRKHIIKKLPNAVIKNIFHIRAGGRNTDIELMWKNINRVYDPEVSKLPFKGKKGKGDGTVPLWSARLAQTPDSQIFNLRKANNHSSLLEHIETLKAVRYIINHNKVPKIIRVKKKEVKSPQMATKKAVQKYLNGIASNQFGLENKKALDPKIWRRILNDIQ